MGTYFTNSDRTRGGRPEPPQHYSDVVPGKVIIDFLPHIAVVPGSRPFIDIPATKLDR